MGVLKDNTLRDFEVSSNGAVVFDASDFPVGESRCVQASDDGWYRLTPSYIVELFLGDDIAGMQVEMLKTEMECLEGAAS